MKQLIILLFQVGLNSMHRDFKWTDEQRLENYKKVGSVFSERELRFNVLYLERILCEMKNSKVKDLATKELDKRLD